MDMREGFARLACVPMIWRVPLCCALYVYAVGVVVCRCYHLLLTIYPRVYPALPGARGLCI